MTGATDSARTEGGARHEALHRYGRPGRHRDDRRVGRPGGRHDQPDALSARSRASRTTSTGASASWSTARSRPRSSPRPAATWSRRASGSPRSTRTSSSSCRCPPRAWPPRPRWPRTHIRVNMTLVFTAPQALLASASGAAFVSPFLGRFDDIGEDGLEHLREIVEALETVARTTPRCITASVRSPVHVIGGRPHGRPHRHDPPEGLLPDAPAPADRGRGSRPSPTTPSPRRRGAKA